MAIFENHLPVCRETTVVRISRRHACPLSGFFLVVVSATLFVVVIRLLRLGEGIKGLNKGSV